MICKEVKMETEIKNKIGIHNRFDIEVIDAKTGELKQTAVGYNVICNNLWTQLIPANTTEQSVAYFWYIQYGSGTGTPSVNDTSLFHREGASPTMYASYAGDTYNSDYANGVASLRRRLVLNPEVAVGVNITEVGIGYGDTNGTICTHAMLQDMNGNPISILKTSTDIINIYATVYIHWDATKDIKIIRLGDVYYSGNSNWTYTIRNWLFGLHSMYYTYSMDRPSYAIYTRNLNYLTYSEYNAACSIYGKAEPATVQFDRTNKKITFVYPRVPATVTGQFSNTLNNRGIPMIIIGSLSGFEDVQRGDYGSAFPIMIECGKTTISPSEIIGESVGTGNGTKTKFVTKFDFPYDATVYVNGVAKTSGVTVHNRPSCTKNTVFQYLKFLNKNADPDIKIPVCPPKTIVYSSSMSEMSYESWPNYILENTAAGSAGYKLEIGDQISDDMINWTTLTANNNNYTGRYFKIHNTDYRYLYASDTYEENNIIFDEPPASGDVITIDYTTPCIPKDSNHVFDLSFTMQFGEYQED